MSKSIQMFAKYINIEKVYKTVHIYNLLCCKLWEPIHLLTIDLRSRSKLSVFISVFAQSAKIET
jgi:hypothetical protein